MDKSGANYAGLANINLLLILAGFATMIDICQVWLHLAKLFQRRSFFNISQSEKIIILGGHVYRPNGVSLLKLCPTAPPSIQDGCFF
jgi:hypothetical protein